MPSSKVMAFTDPSDYEGSVRAADVRVYLTGAGDYQAELTRIDLHELWMQRSRQSLPQIAHSTVRQDRSVIFFLTDAHQEPMRHGGIEVSPGDIIVNSRGAEHHHRMSSECRWGAMSLPPEVLAAAGRAIVGRDVVAPAKTKLIRPSAHLMSRLLNLHETAGHLALTTPDILAHPEVARAVEQELLGTMIACLTAGTALQTDRLGGHLPVMRRFERILEAKEGCPLYVTEVCAEIGVSDRTLRQHCQEHLGMSPHRYLWLRRMHLARRALTQANPTARTVTEIATSNGFGELGRFAVAYRKLFGEPPSATLRRTPDDPSVAKNRAFR